MTETPRKRISTLWVFSAVALTSPLCLLFVYLGKPGTGRAAWMFSGMIVIAARVRWELHEKFWFWGVVALTTIIHLTLVLVVPWTSKWVPAAVIFPFCALDCLAILGMIQLVEKWMSPST